MILHPNFLSERIIVYKGFMRLPTILKLDGTVARILKMRNAFHSFQQSSHIYVWAALPSTFSIPWLKIKIQLHLVGIKLLLIFDYQNQIINLYK